MLRPFSALVIRSGGRTVVVQPRVQIVWSMVADVTAGFRAPGVQRGSGSEKRPVPRAWQEPGGGCGWTVVAEAVLSGSGPVRVGPGGTTAAFVAAVVSGAGA